mmetsp:Transcript_12722/g.26933  ORF Transcript_12722/g.26933 Transcript_12722/m.26933 type:complete len:164 (+) Transcript_12722:454-945(+)
MKQGPKADLPPVFLDLLEAHVSMKQLSGDGEIKPKKMRAIIGAAMANTDYKEKLSVTYVYKMLRKKFPDTVQETKAMQVEDRHMKWTTYPNVNLWFDGSKECLIHYGYTEDKQQLVRDIFIGKPLPCEIPGEKFFHIYCLLINSLSILFIGIFIIFRGLDVRS